MLKADNLFNVLIGTDIARTASVQITDPATTATYIASGEIVVLDKNDNVLTAGSTIADSDKIRFVQGTGTGNPLVYSNWIYASNVTSYTGASYVAAQEQIYYVGYNGSSGSIDVSTAGSNYIIRVLFKHDSEMWSEQSSVLYNEYTSDATPTQSEVAAAFVAKYARTYPSTNSDIKVERVCDGTFTVLGNSATLTVTNGSTTATLSTSSGHNLVAGDVIRIGGTTSTVPVYIVSAVSGTTVTLDSAYQGTSGTVANANVGEMSSVTAWGLKFSGKAYTFNSASVGRFKYMKVAFDLTIQNWGTTAVTKSQEASRGNGTYEEVAELEYFSQGFEGWLSTRNAVPYTPQPRTGALSTETYNTISIKAYDSSDFGVISGIKPSPFQVYLFLPPGASQTTALRAQLNPWMASCPGAFSAVTIV